MSGSDLPPTRLDASTDLGQGLPRAIHPYHHYCRCGACVWDSPYPGGVPGYDEEILCWNCGRDNSRRRPLGLRLKRWYYRKVASRLRETLWKILGVR